LPDPLSPTGFLKLQNHLHPNLQTGWQTAGSIWWAVAAAQRRNTSAQSRMLCAIANRALRPSFRAKSRDPVGQDQ
jgi:hypothetical protein